MKPEALALKWEASERFSSGARADGFQRSSDMKFGSSGTAERMIRYSKFMLFTSFASINQFLTRSASEQFARNEQRAIFKALEELNSATGRFAAGPALSTFAS